MTGMVTMVLQLNVTILVSANYLVILLLPLYA